jgi:hypothetical protein
LAQAGAQRVAFSHAGGLTLSASHQPGGDNPAAIAADFMGGLDLVLVEGFKRAAIDKIEVVAPGKEPMLPQGGRTHRAGPSRRRGRRKGSSGPGRERAKSGGGFCAGACQSHNNDQ